MGRFVQVAVMVGLLSAGTAWGQKKTNTTQVMMQQKLAAAQTLMGSLVSKDYATIEKQARQLRDISKASTWHKKNQSEFMAEAQSFQFAADALYQSAVAKDLGGVSLGFVRTVMSCMMCHNYVRDGQKKP